jgi:hypothetical protein
MDFFFRFGGLWIPITVLGLSTAGPIRVGLLGLRDKYEVHFAANRSCCGDD